LMNNTSFVELDDISFTKLKKIGVNGLLSAIKK
jgi:hypothetical protein